MSHAEATGTTIASTEPARRAVLFQLDLALALAVTVTALLAILTDMPLIIRLPLVLALVLFLPGYGLLCALILGRGLSALERAMIATAASIAVTIVSGLGLAALGIPIERMSWLYVLTAISMAGVLIAWVRRVIRGMPGPQLVIPGMPTRQLAIAIIAILVLANGVMASRLVASQQVAPPPAQLWLVEGSVPTSAELGLRAGPDGGNYWLRVSSSGLKLTEFHLELGPGETWRTNLELSPEQRTRPVVARLYEAGSDVESRYVVLKPAIANPSDGA